MATPTMRPDDGGRNPDLFGHLTGMMPVHMTVVAEPELDAVAINFKLKPVAHRAAPTCALAQLVIDLDGAVDLAARIVGTVERVRREIQARAGER